MSRAQHDRTLYPHPLALWRVMLTALGSLALWDLEAALNGRHVDGELVLRADRSGGRYVGSESGTRHGEVQGE